MKHIWIIILVFALASCGGFSGKREVLPQVPKGVEVVTVKGEALYRSEPTPSVNEKYRVAMEEWKADRSNPDKLIWYGRWTAYCGRYRDAILIFSKGITEHPSDARMLRHRGHRYITIREFDRAIDDLEKAALLVALIPDEVEPDGMPNAANIPVSTLKSNIFYHLGLAYYLDGDLEDALEAWQRDLSLAVNDDMKVATMHWVYMTLREMHRDTEAYAVLTDITTEMNIIENQAYHKLCLFYKGEISFDEVLGSDQGAVMNDALLYGIGNWFLYNDNDQTRALEYFNRIFGAGSWASFGYIAAEVKTARF